MADDATTPDAPAVDADAPTPTVETTATSEPDPTGAEALGDAGKKALDAMKAKWRAERDAATSERERADMLQARLDGREAEWKAEQDARTAADQRFHERLFASELKAAGAAEGVKHPDMLARLIDAKDFPLDGDGNLDSSALTAAVKAAITQYDLAVQDGRRFPGSPDAGPRKEDGPRQYTRADMERMTPDQRAEAFDKGMFADLLAGK